MRTGLLGDIVAMAFHTLRANKLRSSLTILGVVIGITSVVGMTALVRGFDQAVRRTIEALGPDTFYVMRVSGPMFLSGRDLNEVLRRPVLTAGDAQAIEREAPAAGTVDVLLGTMERAYYRGRRTRSILVYGATENWADVNVVDLEIGRFFSEGEVLRRRRVAVLGPMVYRALFDQLDPIGRTIRVGGDEYAVVGVVGRRPTPGGSDGSGAEDFVVIPHTTYEKYYGRVDRGRAQTSASIVVVPRKGVTRETAIEEVRTVLRIRHGLRLDQADDFDIATQESVLALYTRLTQGTFIALVVMASIALVVGGIGVMAIMTISVTERTREIGVRKALGARRLEILWQFLAEAVFLASTGGLLGVLLGSAVGLSVHRWTGFPVSLPWWSFALGLGFSAGVGLFFGVYPAMRASRLDPIEALRYE